MPEYDILRQISGTDSPRAGDRDVRSFLIRRELNNYAKIAIRRYHSGKTIYSKYINKLRQPQIQKSLYLITQNILKKATKHTQS
ncbi:hypothetical protein C1910_10780 [Listeria ivanovii]|nr:hypothetical protein AX25_14150 [Listeria ivanovii WSLC3009]PZG37775.1 hypothetical protein C1910_10780 [Listeria ivanovii]